MDIVTYYHLIKPLAKYPQQPWGAYTVNGLVRELGEYLQTDTYESLIDGYYEGGDMLFMAVMTWVEWIGLPIEDFDVSKAAPEPHGFSLLQDMWLKNFRKGGARCPDHLQEEASKLLLGGMKWAAIDIEFAADLNYGKLAARNLNGTLTKEYGE